MLTTRNGAVYTTSPLGHAYKLYLDDKLQDARQLLRQFVYNNQKDTSNLTEACSLLIKICNDLNDDWKEMWSCLHDIYGSAIPDQLVEYFVFSCLSTPLNKENSKEKITLLYSFLPLFSHSPFIRCLPLAVRTACSIKDYDLARQFARFGEDPGALYKVIEQSLAKDKLPSSLSSLSPSPSSARSTSLFPTFQQIHILKAFLSRRWKTTTAVILGLLSLLFYLRKLIRNRNHPQRWLIYLKQLLSKLLYLF
ncbi:hypothetical protein SJAG_05950 [Schizosaccharomyces japonicus yFS275]|uniref:Uncharacterized protein n=1 Tax=Schizosaccharomyces japonicus (strain yFS275 / FY16936) TaxID=402676 RepID=T0S350_SCHJY|nr:hypothetical protein SJAG_05950 [Schizosaccharomyces japonicus yFS275]EQC53051.1 hypothetical protein SJAG_05950 [Schizosaccharomyces japonicus yFS275]